MAGDDPIPEASGGVLVFDSTRALLGAFPAQLKRLTLSTNNLSDTILELVTRFSDTGTALEQNTLTLTIREGLVKRAPHPAKKSCQAHSQLILSSTHRPNLLNPEASQSQRSNPPQQSIFSSSI